ncbi:MAG: Hsp20/alpha crystallin family protein [Deferribacterales bacterium]|nr:Hsp20/alpha crystallin family protein [Deferribacterales bacterium]
MAIVRWNPVRDLISMQEKMNKIFDDSFRVSGGDWSPSVDIMENNEEIVIIAEIPGVSEDSMDIQVAEGILTMKGEKKFPIEKQSDNYYRLERSFGKFNRSFAIPAAVDQTNVKASLKDGVLKILLKKKPDNSPRVIKVEKE